MHKNPFLPGFLLIILLTGTGLMGRAQERPRLVVGITVDQMRWDYLYRFQARFRENGGFRRMMQGGFRCENTYIPYAPTYTACGHASIYTGSVPAVHGITGNEWYDHAAQDIVYCTGDTKVQTVGSGTAAGQQSPANLLTTTICDELQLSTNFRSKTIGIALKDRGGILAAGHTATAAYWYDSKEGEWITSTYYMNTIPDWVRAFNARGKIDSLYALGWNTLYPANTYVQSGPEKRPYEVRSFGTQGRQFPYDLKAYAGVNYSIISATPHGNTLTALFAREAITRENMGTDSICDFLAVSFSSPDYVGHSFGPNAMELEDTYLRLDQDLGSLFSFLDEKVGEGKYLVFLTADHGASHVPGFLKEHKLPGGLVDDANLNQMLNAEMKKQFGVDNLSLGIVNFQVVMNISLIEKTKNLKEDDVSERMVAWLQKQEMISRAFRLDAISKTTLPELLRQRMSNSYYPARGGQIQVIYKPGYIEGFLTGGTTHGAWYPYDAHIPLLWYGWKVPVGFSVNHTSMTDIAPTLAALLKIQEPNGTVGKVITELFK